MPTHAEALHRRFEESHRRPATAVSERLGAEIERLTERREVRASRAGADDPEVQDLDRSIKAVERRLAARLRELQAEEALTVLDPRLLAVAYVRGTADEELVERHQQDRAVVANAFDGQQLEWAVPFAGYDFAVTEGQDPQFVTVAFGSGAGTVEWNRAERHVATNLGPQNRRVIVTDGEVCRAP